MAVIYPPIKALKEGLDLLGQVRELKLAVGRDGCNRTPLWPSATKTMRCAPSTTEFVFNLPAWLRSLVRPPEGYALAYLDFRQEEPAIAACLSGDPAMMHGYRVGGDLYVDFAKRAHAIPASVTTADAKTRYKAVRDQYKICLLASMYGQQEGYALLAGLDAAAPTGHAGDEPVELSDADDRRRNPPTRRVLRPTRGGGSLLSRARRHTHSSANGRYRPPRLAGERGDAAGERRYLVGVRAVHRRLGGNGRE